MKRDRKKVKSCKAQTNIDDYCRETLDFILNSFGVEESVYVREAILEKMERDKEQLKNSSFAA